MIFKLNDILITKYGKGKVTRVQVLGTRKGVEVQLANTKKYVFVGAEMDHLVKA